MDCPQLLAHNGQCLLRAFFSPLWSGRNHVPPLVRICLSDHTHIHIGTFTLQCFGHRTIDCFTLCCRCLRNRPCINLYVDGILQILSILLPIIATVVCKVVDGKNRCVAATIADLHTSMSLKSSLIDCRSEPNMKFMSGLMRVVSWFDVLITCCNSRACSNEKELLIRCLIWSMFID